MASFLSQLFSKIVKNPAEAPKSKAPHVPKVPHMDFIDITPGTFIMGTEKRFMNHIVIRGVNYSNSLTARQPVDFTGELPHQVTISKAFALGKYPVTQRQWESVMGENPTKSPSQLGSEPFVWGDPDQLCAMADDFLARLNALQSDHTYRLPTEAEWEYACRAGTTGLWFFDNDEKKVMIGAKSTFKPHDGTPDCARVQAWEDEFDKYAVANSRSRKHASPKIVGRKLPNPWGLCDMYGNVWELVQDYYAPYPEGPLADPCCTRGEDRVFRGGSYGSGFFYARSAKRETRSGRRAAKMMSMGFRLVRIPRSAHSTKAPAPAASAGTITEAPAERGKATGAAGKGTAHKKSAAPASKPSK